MLDRSWFPVDLESVGPLYGRTPLLQSALNLGAGYSKEMFSLLCERGANVLAKDFEGDTCLHLCLNFAATQVGQGSGNSPDVERERDALIYLVSQGADVKATNLWGRTVSDIVYSFLPQDRLVGSYRRDLWDAVLVICGYDALEVRGDFLRIYYYEHAARTSWWSTSRVCCYTIDHFRRLWHGWEELCPYPDDLKDTGTREGDSKSNAIQSLGRNWTYCIREEYEMEQNISVQKSLGYTPTFKLDSMEVLSQLGERDSDWDELESDSSEDEISDDNKEVSTTISSATWEFSSLPEFENPWADGRD